MSKLRNITTFLLVLASLLTASFNAQAVVLCFGADGHTAMETASLGSCSQTAAPSCTLAGSTEATLAGIEDQHCGPCHDLSFFNPSGTRRPVSVDGHRDVTPSTPALVVVSQPLRSPETIFSIINRERLSIPSPHPTLTILRTIVLLI